MIGWFLANFGTVVTGFGALIVALVAVYWSGHRDGRKGEARKAERKRADDLEAIGKSLADRADDDPDGARERLRRFGGGD